MKSNIKWIFGLIVLVVCEVASVSAATITVTNTNDSGAWSLRAAIASAAASGDVINFNLAGCPCAITLTSGQITINKSLTINGPGQADLTISGNNTSRIFLIASNVPSPVTIADLTIANGRTTSSEGGGISIGDMSNVIILRSTIRNNTTTFLAGGGIFSAGLLTVRNSTISGNSSSVTGGGIHIGGNTASITSTVFDGNSATSEGGGLAVVNSDVSVSSSTFTGNFSESGGGIANRGRTTVFAGSIESNNATNGAGMSNLSETLTLVNASVTTNTATADGGGIANIGNSSTTSVTDGSSITGNRAQNGGGIKNTGNFSVTNSTVSGNSAVVAGGGVFNNATVNLTGTTVTGNTAVRGGGVYTDLALNLTNSTLSGNQATGSTPGDGGGAVFNANNIGGNATVTALNTTIAGNSAIARGAGIRNLNVVRTKNTIYALNAAPTFPDFDGAVISDGFNLVGNTSGSGGGFVASDLQNVDPNLGPLADNGGLTLTRALLAGSPATNAGTNTNAPNTDQRGVSRPQSATVDIGAFEVSVCGSSSLVTNTNDDGLGSLRCAVAATFNDGGSVDFNLPNSSIIVLASPILIDKPLSINGPSANQLTVSGNNATSIFTVTSTVSISGLTIADGRDVTGTGGIVNEGTLTIDGCSFTGNVGQSGGALFNSDSSFATISNSTFSGNSADEGGAIYNFGFANVSGTLSIVNSTISNNTAGMGGGIYIATTDLSLTARRNFVNVTISGNSAGSRGGGIWGDARIKNSIVATNTSSLDPDIFGIASQGFNLIGNTGGSSSGFLPTDITNVDPLIGPLEDNGGTTFTHRLLPNSPAIDKGGPSGTLDIDQRGMMRPVEFPGIPNAAGGNGSDIGAFEIQAPTAARVSISGRVITPNGRGLANANVCLTGGSGSVACSRTSAFGYFRLDEMEVGQVYLLTLLSRNYVMQPRLINLEDEIIGLDLTAGPRLQ